MLKIMSQCGLAGARQSADQVQDSHCHDLLREVSAFHPNLPSEFDPKQTLAGRLTRPIADKQFNVLNGRWTGTKSYIG
jgi:hypothetical protein